MSSLFCRPPRSLQYIGQCSFQGESRTNYAAAGRIPPMLGPAEVAENWPNPGQTSPDIGRTRVDFEPNFIHVRQIRLGIGQKWFHRILSHALRLCPSHSTIRRSRPTLGRACSDMVDLSRSAALTSIETAPSMADTSPKLAEARPDFTESIAKPHTTFLCDCCFPLQILASVWMSLPGARALCADRRVEFAPGLAAPSRMP